MYKPETAVQNEQLPAKRTVKNHKISATSNNYVAGCFCGCGLAVQQMKPRCITKAGLLCIERRPAVYESSVLCFSYTYLPVAVLRTDLRSVNLCMDISNSKNDTQLFAKTCVSLSEYAGAIHKTGNW